MSCILDFPSAAPVQAPTSISTWAGDSGDLSPELVRLVTAGLGATLDSFRAGHLPLHRFAWELTARLEALDGLVAAPARRVVTRLRWIALGLAALQAEVAAAGRTELTADEENSLTHTLDGLRTALAALGPNNPIDPAGAAHPGTGFGSVVRTLRCVA
jgi:hypothetical protein